QNRIRIGALMSEQANLEARIRQMTDAMNEARSRLEALTINAGRAASELQHLRDSEASLRSERDGLARQLIDARNRVDEMIAARDARAAEIDGLNRRLT